jgi:hypothetical protein
MKDRSLCQLQRHLPHLIQCVQTSTLPTSLDLTTLVTQWEQESIRIRQVPALIETLEYLGCARVLAQWILNPLEFSIPPSFPPIRCESDVERLLDNHMAFQRMGKEPLVLALQNQLHQWVRWGRFDVSLIVLVRCLACGMPWPRDTWETIWDLLIPLVGTSPKPLRCRIDRILLPLVESNVQAAFKRACQLPPLTRYHVLSAVTKTDLSVIAECTIRIAKDALEDKSKEICAAAGSFLVTFYDRMISQNPSDAQCFTESWYSPVLDPGGALDGWCTQYENVVVIPMLRKRRQYVHYCAELLQRALHELPLEQAIRLLPRVRTLLPHRIEIDSKVLKLAHQAGDHRIRVAAIAIAPEGFNLSACLGDDLLQVRQWLEEIRKDSSKSWEPRVHGSRLAVFLYPCASHSQLYGALSLCDLVGSPENISRELRHMALRQVYSPFETLREIAFRLLPKFSKLDAELIPHWTEEAKELIAHSWATVRMGAAGMLRTLDSQQASQFAQNALLKPIALSSPRSFFELHGTLELLSLSCSIPAPVVSEVMDRLASELNARLAVPLHDDFESDEKQCREQTDAESSESSDKLIEGACWRSVICCAKRLLSMALNDAVLAPSVHSQLIKVMEKTLHWGVVNELADGLHSLYAAHQPRVSGWIDEILDRIMHAPRTRLDGRHSGLSLALAMAIRVDQAAPVRLFALPPLLAISTFTQLVRLGEAVLPAPELPSILNFVINYAGLDDLDSPARSAIARLVCELATRMTHRGDWTAATVARVHGVDIIDDMLRKLPPLPPATAPWVEWHDHMHRSFPILIFIAQVLPCVVPLAFATLFPYLNHKVASVRGVSARALLATTPIPDLLHQSQSHLLDPGSTFDQNFLHGLLLLLKLVKEKNHDVLPLQTMLLERGPLCEYNQIVLEQVHQMVGRDVTANLNEAMSTDGVDPFELASFAVEFDQTMNLLLHDVRFNPSRYLMRSAILNGKCILTLEI